MSLPVTALWPREARDFTPWLARHLEILGEALGLELELVDQETAVGDFSAVILARDLGTGRLADDSRPAVNFRPVAFPNDWSRRSATATRAGGQTTRQQRYQQFFQALIDELREEHRFTNARKAQPSSWYSSSSGVTGFTYGVCFGSGRVRAELCIDTRDAAKNEAAFQKLLRAREAIQKELGEGLDWQALEGKRACRIAAFRDGTIDDPDDKLEEARRWAVEQVLLFRKVFGPRLQRP